VLLEEFRTGMPRVPGKSAPTPRIHHRGGSTQHEGSGTMSAAFSVEECGEATIRDPPIEIGLKKTL
jgi:hypothetical protein